ncbi:MAG: hypothetical protein E7539_05665 [Ruminococcaceae bacterium]|nr:hypothetical protein [Oscillospiraceae bacterium]
MSFNLFGVRIKISFLLIVMLALFSFYDKSGFVLLAISAAIIHELGHVVAAEIFKCGVKKLEFMPFGIKMVLNTPLSIVAPKPKIAVLSAGCVVNFLLFAAFWALSLKNAAIIHLITGAFNLLPAGTLDGGRILNELLCIKFEAQKAEKISDVVSLFSAFLLFILGTFVLFYSGYNISLLITSIYLASLVIVRQKKLNY